MIRRSFRAAARPLALLLALGPLAGCALNYGLTLGEEAVAKPTVLQEARGGGGGGGGSHDGRDNTKTIGKPKLGEPTFATQPPPDGDLGSTAPPEGDLPAVQRNTNEPGSAAGADVNGDNVGFDVFNEVDETAGPSPHMNPGELGGTQLQ